MSVIDDIKARIDLVELVSETVKLRRSGRALMGLCPFHPHKSNTPSFAVWPDSGTWRCFGQCNEGGDAFKFVMKRDGVDFAEALRTLAARAGVELQERSAAEQEQTDNLDHLRQLLEAAATWYAHLLKNTPQAQGARAHLAGRGLDGRAIEIFQLGYALPDWEAGLKYFTSKGYAAKDLLDAGLIVEKEAGTAKRTYDRFRDRLMIPVRDERGRMTGFQARALQPEATPKFMNSPQTALFDKGRTVFGLHLARKPIREAEAAIVVEGNLDVIAAHQAGFANVVSSQGTALTEHQLRLIKKHTKRIILCLDADAAGDAATLRGLTVAREALDREAEIMFDPRGLVKTEGRLGADIRVMTLPEGLDPDDVIRRDPAEWQTLVQAAESVVSYVIRVLTTGRNLNDPKIKVEVAGAVLPLIEDVAQPIERETYYQQLARVLRVDERELVLLRRPARPSPRPVANQPAATPVAQPTQPVAALALEASKLETYCLSALLHQPELLYQADRELQTLGLVKLAPGDFFDTQHQLLFVALTTALGQMESDPRDYLSQNLNAALWPRYMALLQSLEAENASEPKSTAALLAAVLRLRRRTVSHWLKELRFLAEEAREHGDARAEPYQAEIAQQAATLARVDAALARQGRRGPTRQARLSVR